MTFRKQTTYLLLTVFAILSNNFSVLANEDIGAIYVNLQKMQSLKRVLYIAAHPDDENTRALAYFSLDEKAETAYLSLTRGDGGQNLIGDELSEDLGVLRTQELLAARSFDKAKQYFTRAVDFGYSKSAKESLELWGNDEILSDVVLVIRQFKPDVIITRFPPDKRGGHGHHTASAMLAIEAFEKAADKNYLPEQVRKFGTWQTGSLYWNASSWWNKELKTTAVNNPEYIIQDIGGYNTLLGKSYTEIGTIARSQHKCQGFGAILDRGTQLEYFEYMKGTKLKDGFFENNTRTWTSLINKEFEAKLDSIVANFNFVDLEKNVPALLALRKDINNLPESTFKTEKLARCTAIIQDCLGLYVEAISNDYAYVQGSEIDCELNLLNRSNLPVKLVAINLGTSQKKVDINLPTNEIIVESTPLKSTNVLSNPYWLQAPFNTLFTVKNAANLGKAEGSPSYHYSIVVNIDGTEMPLPVAVEHKWKDPSYGERRRSVITAPSFSANFDEKIVILQPEKSKKIRLQLHSFEGDINDKLTLSVPSGWTVTPCEIPVKIDKKNEDVWVEFELKASNDAQRGNLVLKNNAGDEIFSYTEIVYDHIPTQVIFRKADLTCIKLDAKINPGKVAYIKGVDDAVPQAISQLGFDVEVFEVKDLANIDLNKYQSVVFGIRIYNVYPEVKNFDTKLYTYVENGGNLIIQYNTAGRQQTGETFGGPLPFELSRNRVTEEDAPVKFLAPKHQIMNTPNAITQKDFENWVQERGLYFANNWDKAYQPLFSWHDEDEAAQDGALIVAQHGKGQIIYTGISFFRELPNGVEGAYRLFANLLSYQND
ncbi:PIG-L family deacetylase [Crocinitomix catalasitica]|uniref:PIG-L family deacetylase n=1 Tax=Crocinitomix catalasitica TaxID=184607 RepID=UPI00055D8687|nr:PIG-L family deacetylase [Crocinitomix catalasitica]